MSIHSDEKFEVTFITKVRDLNPYALEFLIRSRLENHEYESDLGELALLVTERLQIRRVE